MSKKKQTSKKQSNKQAKKRKKKYTPKQVKQKVTQPVHQFTGPSNQQIRILVWGASPYVITGFGNVMKHMLSRLFRKYPGQYTIAQMGINYHGDYVDELEITGGFQNGRYAQWPAAAQRAGVPMSHMFGQARFLELVKGSPMDYDLIFLAEDPFWLGGVIPTDPPGQQRIFIDEIRKALQMRNRAHVPVIGYFPIDGIPDPDWITNLAKYDVAITYLPFGAKSVASVNPNLEGKVMTVPLGLDPSEYYVIPEEELRAYKRAYFGEENVDKYVVLNCNRNQIRKFLPSNMMAFAEFKKKYPDSILYMHMRAAEQVGWDLPKAARNIGLEVGKDIFFPHNFNINKGMPVEELNKIFNVADMLTTTALGGGWELALTQAFATKTVVVAPSNTSHTDLCADNRGILYKCGDRMSHKVILRGDNEVIRPLPDVDDMVEKMIWARENPEEVEKIKENAYNWTHENILWDNLIGAWHEIFVKCRVLRFKREAQIRQQQLAMQQAQQQQQKELSSQGAEADLTFQEQG